MAAADRQFVDALARGLGLLEALSRAQRPLSNGELSKAAQLAPSTVSRLTHTLTALGYTRLAPGGRAYELTPKNLALGYPILAGMSLIERARPLLKHLAEVTGETAALAVRDGLHITFVEVVPGTNMVAVRLAMGGRLPIAVSAAGIALMAALPERERRTLATRVRSYITARDGDMAAFDRCYEQAGQDGIALIRDAWRPGIGGVSVAVRTDNDVAALTIPVATGSVSEATMRGPLAEAIRTVAQRLEQI